MELNVRGLTGSYKLANLNRGDYTTLTSNRRIAECQFISSVKYCKFEPSTMAGLISPVIAESCVCVSLQYWFENGHAIFSRAWRESYDGGNTRWAAMVGVNIVSLLIYLIS